MNDNWDDDDYVINITNFDDNIDYTLINITGKKIEEQEKIEKQKKEKQKKEEDEALIKKLVEESEHKIINDLFNTTNGLNNNTNTNNNISHITNIINKQFKLQTKNNHIDFGKYLTQLLSNSTPLCIMQVIKELINCDKLSYDNLQDLNKFITTAKSQKNPQQQKLNINVISKLKKETKNIIKKRNEIFGGENYTDESIYSYMEDKYRR
jgi:hypothetical protein